MNKPYQTPNPLDFRLDLVWGIGSSTRMIAKFSSCKWLPRIGETLVLPIDEAGDSKSWRKFKVVDVVYDFQYQVVRVLCGPIKSATSYEVDSYLPAHTRERYPLGEHENPEEELERLKAELLNFCKRSPE